MKLVVNRATGEDHFSPWILERRLARPTADTRREWINKRTLGVLIRGLLCWRRTLRGQSPKRQRSDHAEPEYGVPQLECAVPKLSVGGPGGNYNQGRGD